MLNLLLVSLLLVGYTPARAQFPINESFTGTAAPAFSTGGNAALTRGANDTGYLRLTSATGNQAGYAILNI
ncbi:MAG: hypothetical protein EOO62_37515 [Hymenobacter sp.]|nr:MAG: hypothetical protein EOO62_37515 [Hymenobacter sp.]